jgi:hypothetical protein
LLETCSYKSKITFDIWISLLGLGLENVCEKHLI